MTSHVEGGESSRRIGPFRLVRALGAGGFAPVYLAVEEHGGLELRAVALKVFSRGASSAAERARIIAEARALCRVDHPNIVRFLQLVEDTDGTLALAMEHVRGRALSSRIDAGELLSLPEALAMGRAVASALAAVHAAGLVHRDLKPANILEADQTYRLIDFGIAVPDVARRASSKPKVSLAAPERGAGTEPRAVIDVGDATLGATAMGGEDEGDGTFATAGTMGYIDPVCLAGGQPADASSDLYGLGVTLFECLTGRLPASAEADAQARSLKPSVMFGYAPPPSVRELAPDLPKDVIALVDALLAPARADRPARAEWVAAELDRLGRAARGAARALPSSGPFRGLAAFEDEHRDLFLGRAADVAAALEALRARGLVLLVGASGSGKTSLARAGVVPALCDGELGPWPRAFASVEASLDRAPREAITRALGDAGFAVRAREPEALAADLAAHVQASGRGLVLVLDALEELVTLASADEREWTARLVSEIARRPLPGLRVVASARRDMLDALLALEPLGAVLARSTQLVVPLSSAALASAFEERCGAYGVSAERGLVEALERELRGLEDAMPLVEFALERLWDARDRGGGVLTAAALAAMGGVAGALERHAEGTFATMRQALGPEAEGVARAALLALTTAQGTRRAASEAEIAEGAPSPLTPRVLEALASSRLLGRVEGKWVIQHEVVVRAWSRLARWVREASADRALAEEIEADARRHADAPGVDRLLRGRALRAARALERSGGARLSPAARAFLRASRRFELRSVVGAFALPAVVVVGALVLLALYVRAERETRAEREGVKSVVAGIRAGQDRSKTELAIAMEQLVRDKHACEAELARVRGGAGDPRDAGKEPSR